MTNFKSTHYRFTGMRDTAASSAYGAISQP